MIQAFGHTPKRSFDRLKPPASEHLKAGADGRGDAGFRDATDMAWLAGDVE